MSSKKKSKAKKRRKERKELRASIMHSASAKIKGGVNTESNAQTLVSGETKNKSCG